MSWSLVRDAFNCTRDLMGDLMSRTPHAFHLLVFILGRLEFRSPSSMLAAAALLFLILQKVGGDGGFREVALRVHNDHRQRINLAPLQLDSGLNVVAQRHATTLATEEKFYGSGGGYGRKENLWAFYGSLRTLADDVSQATNDWFSGSTTSSLVKVNHETMFSNETTLFGVGVETNPIGYSVVVANYL